MNGRRILGNLISSLSLASTGAAIAKEPAVAESYMLTDGSIALFGNDGMETVTAAIAAIVTRDRPEIRFTLTAKGSSVGMPALTAGATLLAPMSREAWPRDLAAFKQVHGYAPTVVRIGYSGWGPRSSGNTPPAIYVNRANPLASLATERLAGIFTRGSAAGDISLWSQLGIAGEDGTRRIHIYGLRDNGGFATAFRENYFAGLPFAPSYESLADYAAVIRAVAADPYGIAFTGWIDAEKVSPNVRILPLSIGGAQSVTPDRSKVALGLYPLEPFLNLYVDKVPGQPLAPVVKAFLKAALSDEGQAIIGREADSDVGYLPLAKDELERQRALVDSL